jgi:leukotriene-A4 hydrolase
LKLPVELKYNESLATQAYDLASDWDAARDKNVSDLHFKAEDMKSFDSNQKGEHAPLFLRNNNIKG